MVSNYDRIYAEIQREVADVTATAEHAITPDALLALVMEIVELEDQHRTKHLQIRKLVEDRITTTAIQQLAPEES